MHVHRSVGQVTFVTCDMVLGEPDTVPDVEGLLDQLEPTTVAVDLTADDLDNVIDGEIDDPFLAAHAAGVEDVENELEVEPLEPYRRLIEWTQDSDAEIQPLTSKSSVGIVKARRIKRIVTRAEGTGPEDRARAAVDDLLDDAQIGPLTKRRRRSLSENLSSLMRREPPRTVAFFTFPWGEMVSADVRRELGLRRIEGEKMAGGWPD